MKRELVLLDSISKIGPAAAGHIVVSGSHGGTSAAQFVLDVGGSAYPDLVIYNDAGVGKNGAGIAALDMLERAGVAAATYSHDSACIGDAEDGYRNGVVTHANARAAALNIEAGRSVFELVEELRR
jgi:hypothetical protein